MYKRQGTIKLLTNGLTESSQVSITKTVTLDLGSAKVLNLKDPINVTGSNITFTVNSTGTAGSLKSSAQTVRNTGKGTVIIKSAKLSTTSTTLPAISNEGGGTLKLSGTTITSDYYIISNTSGSTIIESGTYDGGIVNRSTMTISGGTITNKSLEISTILSREGSTLNITGGKIYSQNSSGDLRTTIKLYNTNKDYSESPCKATISGGTIYSSNEEASTIQNYYSDLTITGGTIEHKAKFMAVNNQGGHTRMNSPGGTVISNVGGTSLAVVVSQDGGAFAVNKGTIKNTGGGYCYKNADTGTIVRGTNGVYSK